MQNKMLKFAIILAIVVFLFSSFCYATDDNSAGDEITTTSVEEANTEENVDLNEENAISSEENDEDDYLIEDSSDEDMVEKDYFYLGREDLVLEDTIDSNAFIIANNVTIKSEIGGDLFVMANSVKLDGGYVYGNVFVLAKDFTLNATVYDIYAACNKITIEYDGVIYRDFRATANEISISGGVGRNCYISTDKLVIGNDALIYGDLNYTSKKAAEIPEGTIQGEVIFNENSDNDTSINVGKSFGNYAVSLIAVLVFTLVIYGLMISLAPNFYSRLSKTKISKIFIGLCIGIVALIVIPIVSIILLFTQIGMSLSLALLTLYFLMLTISSAISYITIGTLIANKVGNATKLKTMLFVLATALVFFLINLIPVIGALLVFLTSLSGFGILIITVLSKDKKVNAE